MASKLLPASEVHLKQTSKQAFVITSGPYCWLLLSNKSTEFLSTLHPTNPYSVVPGLWEKSACLLGN